MSEAGRSEFIVYSYEDYISNEKRILRRKTGNTEHQHKMLMQKVYTMENNKRVPLLHVTEKNGTIYTKYVYKAINAWGDSFRAQEFYTTGQQSVLDNGFDKVANEVEDSVIVDIYRGGVTAPVSEEENRKLMGEPTEEEMRRMYPEIYEQGEKINIYAGTGENAELSNFAIRPFVPNATKAILGESATIKFNTVEGAFQAAKVLYTNNLSKEDNDFNKSIVGELQTATGAEAKRLGQQIKGLNSSEWDKVSANVMKDLMSASFEQNPDALNNLLATGNAELTHTQDKTKWAKEFPKLLMEVRQELRPTQPVSEKPKKIINQPKVTNQYEAIDYQNIKDQLVNKDYYVEIGEGNRPIKIKKENVERYLKNANNPEWMLLTKGMDDKFYEAEMPEPKHNIFLDNNSMEYVSIQDMVEDVTVGDPNYELSAEEKQAVTNYLKQYGIDVSSQEERVKVDNSTLKDGDVVYDKLGTKFIFRGLRQADQTGAGSPRLERTDGTGEIAIPGANIELFKESITKPDSISQEEWDGLSQEEKNKINEC
jgi:predicted NAD-dependent protein-ADP-ribosyltransferase YbiA (DUF1768 family)